ncbi:MAG: hypothetical protein K9G66_03950 [Rhodoluna sp.]|nr:hypothetical protein [Rhodoluna sp.]
MTPGFIPWVKGHSSLFLVALAMVIGVAAKLSLTSGALLPGLDGAYYWVQVRKLMEQGQLAFPDVPLIFAIQGFFAWCVGDIKFGVRLTDAILPALSAIPIFFMLRNAKQVWLPALVVLMVLLHPVQLFFLTGDFIKNEAAIPLVFVTGLILAKWNHWPKRVSIVSLVLTQTLLAFAHFGTLILSLAICSIWLVLQLINKSRRFVLTSAGVALSAGIGAAVLLNYFVPARFEKLMGLVSNPLAFFQNPAILSLKQTYFLDSLNFALITGQFGAVLLAWIAYKNRDKFDVSTLKFLAANLTAAGFFSSPLIGQEWAARFVALSFVPLLLAFTVLIGKVQFVPVTFLLRSAAALTIAMSLIALPAGGKFYVTTPDRYREFVSLMKTVELPDNSVVVADHGLEYLVAWELKTKVIETSYYSSEVAAKYQNVYVLRQKYASATNGYYGIESYSPKKDPSESPKETEKGLVSSIPTGAVIYQSNNFALSQIRPVIEAAPASVPADFPTGIPLLSGKVLLGISPGADSWVVKVQAKQPSQAKAKAIQSFAAAGFELRSDTESSSSVYRATFVNQTWSVRVEITTEGEILYVVGLVG